MNLINSLESLLLSSLGAKDYHMLSTSNFTNKRNSNLVDKLQTISRLTLNSSVILILYTISNICDLVYFGTFGWRNKMRLLSLGRSLDGHSPYSSQVLQAPTRGLTYD